MISITCMLVIATIQSKIDRMLPKVSLYYEYRVVNNDKVT